MGPKVLVGLVCLLGWVLESGRNLPSFTDEIDIHTLTSIDYDEGEPLPKEIQSLDGASIRISGYLHLFRGETDRFYLVPDPCACGGRPKIQEFVEVKLENESVRWSGSLITIEGTLSVGEVEEDGFVTSIYRLEGNVH